MGKLLRAITQSNWLVDDANLPQGELSARALRDLEVDNNHVLSMWWVSDDHANLDDVLTALASTRHHPSAMRYRLVEADDVTGLGLSVATIPGKTPYESVNHWHRDVGPLSCDGLVQLAKVIQRQETHQATASRIKSLLKDAVAKDLLSIGAELSGSLDLPSWATEPVSELEAIVALWPSVNETVRQDVIDLLGI